MNEVAGYVCIGDIPESAVAALWPDANLRDRSVWLNVENVRRHLSAKRDGIARLAVYESNVGALMDCLRRVVCFIRYERVGDGELGLDVIVPDSDPSSTAFPLIGVRISEHPTTLSYVATVYRVDAKFIQRQMVRRRTLLVGDARRQS